MQDGAATPSCLPVDIPPVEEPPVLGLISTPCLCGHCRDEVVAWLEQYERGVRAKARRRLRRYGYLDFALSMYVVRHLKHLREHLVAQPSRIIEIAQKMFPSSEIVEKTR